jgi:hypothetical protein
MKTDKINLSGQGMSNDHPRIPFKIGEPLLLFILLLMTWFFVPPILQGGDQTIGIVDQSMWVLLILSMISFLMVCGICWWLVKHFWLLLGLPELLLMVSQFKTLDLWQQLSFFLASFVSLLLVATGCLVAIC